MKKLILFLAIIVLLVFMAIFCYFLLPTKVISISPEDQSINNPVNTQLIIKFDKPVKRQELSHIITPNVLGQWDYKDSIIKNHLYKTLVFTPAIAFESGAKYKIELNNITSFLGFGSKNKSSFVFNTKKDSVLLIKANEEKIDERITIVDVVFNWQKYPLSCEAASLKMALSAKKIFISEDEIMGKIGYDKSERKENIWGDPNKAFVGDISGKMCETGYGVYWSPVAIAANNWRPAESFTGWELSDLTRELELGNSVIFWGVIPTGKITDCSWQTIEGKYIKAVKQAHVRLVVGFIGESKNPSKIIIKDPLSGDLYWSTADFLDNWRVFGYSGVVVRCAHYALKLNTLRDFSALNAVFLLNFC